MAVNGDDITSDGDLTFTPAGGDTYIVGDFEVDASTLLVDSTSNRVGIGIAPTRTFQVSGLSLLTAPDGHDSQNGVLEIQNLDLTGGNQGTGLVVKGNPGGLASNTVVVEQSNGDDIFVISNGSNAGGMASFYINEGTGAVGHYIASFYNNDTSGGTSRTVYSSKAVRQAQLQMHFSFRINQETPI